MITGCLQEKSGYYYAVLYLKENGKRRCKWIPLKLPVEGTGKRKAQQAFDSIRLQYEKEEEERLAREAQAKELAEQVHPDALLLFTDYLEKWLQVTRSSIAIATYQSYANMLKARIKPYFEPLALHLYEVTPQHIEDFYQSILADNCTTNTVIHFHAIIRKALQTAVKKDILPKVRFHDLRHTCASLLLSNGISMKQIQIWLGHSTFATTADIYAHLDYSAQEASANAMSRMFSRKFREEQPT